MFSRSQGTGSLGKTGTRLYKIITAIVQLFFVKKQVDIASDELILERGPTPEEAQQRAQARAAEHVEEKKKSARKWFAAQIAAAVVGRLLIPPFLKALVGQR